MSPVPTQAFTSTWKTKKKNKTISLSGKDKCSASLWQGLLDHDSSCLGSLSIPVSLAADEISSLGHNTGMQGGRCSVSIFFSGSFPGSLPFSSRYLYPQQMKLCPRAFLPWTIHVFWQREHSSFWSTGRLVMCYFRSMLIMYRLISSTRIFVIAVFLNRPISGIIRECSSGCCALR